MAAVGAGEFRNIEEACDATIRVVLRNDGRNVESASDTLSYEIEQTQNPQLTVKASSNPIIEATRFFSNAASCASRADRYRAPSAVSTRFHLRTRSQ